MRKDRPPQNLAANTQRTQRTFSFVILQKTINIESITTEDFQMLINKRKLC